MLGDLNNTKVIPDRLRRSHRREEEHGTAEGLLIYKETMYHNIMNEKSQNVWSTYVRVGVAHMSIE